MTRTVHAHLRLIPPEPSERLIILRFVENEGRPDIILSTGEAALVALEIEQALGEANRPSKPSNGHKRLSLKFSKHEN